MSLSGFLPVVSRRAIVIGGVVLAGAVSVAALHAQQTTPPAAPQTPAAPAQAEPLKFTTPGPRVILLTLTQDAGQAFETALTRAKEELAKSTKQEDKDQLAHWKVLQGTQTDPSGATNVVFFFMLDQTSVGQSYNPFVILQAAGLSADEYTKTITPLYEKVNTGLKGYLPIEGKWSTMGG
jgi:hypothetical protein